MTGEPIGDLARYVTGVEAKQLAAHLAAGETLSQALGCLAANRRDGVRTRLADAGLGVAQRDLTVAVLRAVAGALEATSRATAVWTVPDGQARLGELTSGIYRHVEQARQSITCANYNLQESSELWAALERAARRPEIEVRLYLDGVAAHGSPLEVDAVAARLPGAEVLATPGGGASRRRVKSHAKFLVVDHRWSVVTSANLSASAERFNVELGLLIDDRIVAEQIELQMRRLEGSIYHPIG